MTLQDSMFASARIMELNLSDIFSGIYNQGGKLPQKSQQTQPRLGGLCASIFGALDKRVTNFDPTKVFLPATVTAFNREKKIVLNKSVKGHDVFVVLDFALPDPTTMDPAFFGLVNFACTDLYVSLAQMAGQAARNNSAKSVNLLVPNFPYARQDKDHGERGPISAQITAQNLEPYFNTITSVHLHSPAIKGMVRGIPLQEISSKEIYTPSFVLRDPDTLQPITTDHLTLEGTNKLFNKLSIASPDAGGVKNAHDFIKYCKTFAAVILGVDESKIATIPPAHIDKLRTGPNNAEVMHASSSVPLNGRIVAIIDDMGDTFGTARGAATAFKEMGAARVEFWGTHGYFSGNALDTLHASDIAQVNIGNTTDFRQAARNSTRVRVMDIGPILAQIIIDHITPPATNMEVPERHMANEVNRDAVGRYVHTMMP